MSHEQSYNHLLDTLLQGVDLNDDVAKKIAYNRCLEYAQEELGGASDVNIFLALAAERLGQTRIHLSVIKGMVSMPEDARLHLVYTPQGGPTLTGNISGLRYLSDLCATLADAPVADERTPPEHIHLYDGEPPMCGNSFGLTLYNEPDTWFDKNGIPPDDVGDTVDENISTVPRREITPEQIAAFEFFENGPLPPVLLLRFDKLYRVLEARPYRDDEVWSKPFADGEDGRAFVFTIRDDSDSRFEMALHLDDPSIHFFTFHDLEQVLGQ